MSPSENRAQIPASRQPRSLFNELTSALVLLVTLVSVAGSVITYGYFSQQVQREQQNRKAEYANYLRDSLEWPLWNIDDELITKIGAAFTANPEMATLIVRDEAQRVIYRYESPQASQDRQIIAIEHAGRPIGSIEFGISLRQYEARERQWWLTSMATTILLIVILIVAIRWILSRTLRTPIDAMIAATQDMVDGQYQQIKLPDSYKEFAAILTGFKTMSDAVANREDRLRQSNSRLVLEVAERQKAQQELLQLSQRNRLILNAAGEGIYGQDTAGLCTFANPSATQLLGYAVEELLGQDVHTLFHHTKPDGQPYPPEECPIRATFTAGVTRRGVEHFLRKDGGSFPVEFVSSPIEQEGQTTGAVVIFSDITERQQAEQSIRELNASLEERITELAAASAAKSQFLAHMSHEIRTPMNAILGLTQVLQNEGLTPAQADLLHKVSAAGDSLLHIINDILDIAKIEASQLEIDAKPFRLSAVITRIDQLLQHAASVKGLALHFPSTPGDTDALIGDRLRLEQVLINLVNNAIKFTAQGSVTLAVTPLAEEATTVRLRFEVRDTGIGMAPDALARLFQPFTQGDNSITRRFGGTGLGLAISKQLVELMGGAIGVTSQVGQGSTFWFEIPFPKAEPELTPSDQPTPAERPPSGPGLAGLRVLEVDDNRINLLVVERALQQAGAIVTLAADGQQALDILTARPGEFDVVLMDIQMPVMDGLTATREIRRNPALATLPVIALSAGVLAEERTAALAAGVNDFLAKPLDLRQMHAVLAPLYLDSVLHKRQNPRLIIGREVEKSFPP